MNYKNAAKKIRNLVKKHYDPDSILRDNKDEVMISIDSCISIINGLQNIFKIDNPEKIMLKYDIGNRRLEIRIPDFGDRFTISFDNLEG